MSWMPINKEELEQEIEDQCRDLDQDEIVFFRKIRVPLESVDIDRWGKIESVFIVARVEGKVVFYEDVEEGFEISSPNEQGVITEYGANQFTLQHVINQLRASCS